MAKLYRYPRTGGWRITVNIQGARRAVYLDRGEPKKSAEAFREKAGKLERAKAMATEVDPRVAEWVQELSPQLRSKLAKAGLIDRPVEAEAAEAARLESFLEGYIASRAIKKPNTARNYGQTKRYLVEHFGGQKRVDEITPGDADRFKSAMQAKLSDATVSREVKRARQFFRAAVRDRLITENPFADVKGGKQGKSRSVLLRDSRSCGGGFESLPR